jgi:hypothetical protein
MERVFGIIPATSGPYIFIWIFSVVMGVITLGVIAMLVMFGYQAKHAQFTVNDQGLRINPGMYSRFIPKEDINTAGVKVINLNTESAYKPKWRTNGAGLPGYAAGWFKLANKEKALVFVTDRSSVVYIPTTENYSVLLSVREADEFADLIQHWNK